VKRGVPSTGPLELGGRKKVENQSPGKRGEKGLVFGYSRGGLEPEEKRGALQQGKKSEWWERGVPAETEGENKKGSFSRKRKKSRTGGGRVRWKRCQVKHREEKKRAGGGPGP